MNPETNPDEKINLRLPLMVSAAALVFMAALSAWAWNALPDDVKIPVHWGINGKPDRYGGKMEGLLVMPLIAAAIIGVFAVIPRIEPRKLNLAQSRTALFALWIAMLALFTAIHAALVATALGHKVDMNLIVPLCVGGLFIIMGNYFGKIRSNFLMGIRTPWTLSSELAWDKTHRLGGRLFVALGILMALTPLIGVTGLWIGLVVAGSVGGSLALVVYSYFIWRADPDKQERGRG